MKKINLNGKWEMFVLEDKKFIINPPLPDRASIQALCGAPLSANIPESAEITLEREGRIPSLYFGANILEAQKLEYNHYYYIKEFEINDDHQYDLCFEGIDTFSDIYCNGEKLLSTDNMHMTYTIERAALKIGKNSLIVHIHPASIMSRQYETAATGYSLKYNMDSLSTRKAAYQYGWDIMPRILSAGIWRDVYLTPHKDYSLKQNYLFTEKVDTESGYAKLHVFCEFDLGRASYKGFTVELTGKCGESEFHYACDIWGNSIHNFIHIHNAKLWWPTGSGEQNLYECEIILKHNGEIVDKKHFDFGIRTVKLEHQSQPDESGFGKFCFIINNRKIAIKGTNWVPTDALPSRCASRNIQVLEMVRHIGCNMIRCWGGGLYESEELYQYCDKFGILIWQDFALGCALYPQNEAFLNRLKEEFTQIVHRLRQHSAIVFWAGDNECDEACYWAGTNQNPNDNKITRQLLPDILREHDNSRPYLPSSPYIDNWCHENNLQYRVEDHLWGPRDYYKSSFYKNSKAVFVSETGYHGCPSVASMKKFISEEHLWPYENNDEWLLHAASPAVGTDETFAYRIPLMANQIKVLFGDIPNTLEDFALASQISQAEAKKYFIERVRLSKWNRTGVIWWNICDGWPQFSDAVVDYYFDKKLAYDYIKRCQQPLCLMFDEPCDNSMSLYACNDTQEDLKFTFEIMDASTHEILMKDTAIAMKDSAAEIGKITLEGSVRFLLIKWTCSDDRYNGSNHYLYGLPPFSLEQYKEWHKLL